MWSFGCILAELVTKRPLFPALDENELLEFFILIIGHPTESMIEKAKKRHKFFSPDDGSLLRSVNSRLASSHR
jgi:dual specificity tyrosine-phosphorylation-regulated kinase 2/3/4